MIVFLPEPENRRMYVGCRIVCNEVQNSLHVLLREFCPVVCDYRQLRAWHHYCY